LEGKTFIVTTPAQLEKKNGMVPFDALWIDFEQHLNMERVRDA